MTASASKVVPLSPRSAMRVALLDQPPLGHLQALILHTLQALGDEASGYGVLEALSIETGVWIDHSQIYGTLRKLEHSEFIELVETRKQQRRGPPLKIYSVTAAGRAALKETAEHHRAVAEFLEDKNKRKATRV